MAENNNIKNYSAADIEKYWKGKLSNGEMHALEKAAMDDPFLADALEGYKNSISPSVETGLLHEKLKERILSGEKGGTIIKMRFPPWLRIAAVIVVLAGLGFLTQQIFLNKKENEIAKIEKSETPVVTNTGKAAQTVLTDSSSFSASADVIETKKSNNNISLDKEDSKEKTIPLKDDSVKSKELDKQSQTIILNENVVIAAPRQAETIKEAENLNETLAKTKKESRDVSFQNDKPEELSKQKKQFAPSTEKQSANYFSLTNKYFFKVVDAQNNPVPFANVYNIKDNVRTYTDIKGTFNLISSDSVLEVQIKSLGYNSKNYRLVPGTTLANLVLEGDAKAREDVLVNNRKVVSSRTREETTGLEEPEVGWDSYNIYVLNNLALPENLPFKKNGSEVELSFQVDKTGSPVNIKVTKTSGCKQCDEAAVKVLKQGPRWSRKGKKSKPIVSIVVDK